MSGKKVSLNSDNHKGVCPGVVFDHADPPQKGLVVIQEWWGVNDQIQKQAKEIGEEGGFITIVPDLYRGKVFLDKEQANRELSTFDWSGAVEDIRAAVLYLKHMGCKKVGVTGFGMGGALSLAAAVRIKEVDAAAPFYGIPDSGLCDVSKITCPVQCHFGEEDALVGFSSPKDANALKEKLRTSGMNFEFYTYKGAGHAFTNRNSLNFHKESCKKAMERLYSFMNKNLQ